MAGAKFEYDESGSTFYYFVASFTALILLPSTYWWWPRAEEQDDAARKKYECHCRPCNVKQQRLRAAKPWQKLKINAIKLGFAVVWLLLLLMVYKISTLERDYVEYDPFEVLQIDRGASVGEIKKQYRELSRVYHPDNKDTGDERMFKQIAKAKAALTDEESRKNWEEYGNPDGPGAMTFGIALPSWIVEKQNSIFVLAVYALVFIVALPVVVGTWWYRTIKYSGEQVLLATTQMYFYFFHKTPHMIQRRVLMILAASMEFERSHNPEIQERESDNIALPQLIKDLPYLGEKSKERPFCYPYSVKARALLHAHLSRLDLPLETLDQDRMYILNKCPALVGEMVSCVAQLMALARAGRVVHTPSLDTIEHVMRVSTLLVQALWENKSPLLQLPHFTDDILRHCVTKKRNIRTVRDIIAMKDVERRQLLRTLGDEQYTDVLNVCKAMPYLSMDVTSKVLDDEDSATITVGAIVTMEVTLRRRHLEELFEKEPDAQHLDDDKEEMEEEKQAAAAADDKSQKQERKPKAWEKQKKKKGKPGGGKKKPEKKTTVVKRNVVTVGAQEAPTPNGPLKAESDAAKTKTGHEKSKDKESDGDIADSEPESDSGSDSVSTKETHHDKDGSEGEAEDDDWDSFNVKKRKETLETKSRCSHSVHCPHFPEDKQEWWWLYVADRRHRALVTAPYLVTNLITEEEVLLKFAAPSRPGVYTYSVICRSDSYVDTDIYKHIKLEVKEARQVEDHPQWDISDDDDDAKEEDVTDASDYTTDSDDSD